MSRDSDTGEPTDDGIFASGVSSRRRWPGDTRWATEGGVVGGLVLLASLGVLWRLGGDLAVVLWIPIAVSWLVFPPIVAVGIGQFAVVALAPTGSGVATTLPASATLLGLLGADLLDGRSGDGDGVFGRPTTGQVVHLGWYLGVTVALAGTLLSVASRWGVLVASVTGVAAFGVLSYLLHRYLLVGIARLADDTDDHHTDT